MRISEQIITNYPMEAAVYNLAILAKKTPSPGPWYDDFGWPAYVMALIGVIILIAGIRAITASENPAVANKSLVIHVFCIAFAAAMGFFLHQFMEFHEQSQFVKESARAIPENTVRIRLFIAKHDMVSSVVVMIGTFLGFVAASRARLGAPLRKLDREGVERPLKRSRKTEPEP